MKKNLTLSNLLLVFFSTEKYPLYLFLFSTVTFFTVNIIGLSEPVFSIHSFRQSQTALTSYYLIENGFSFNYETPVVGFPWSIPFEFPLYQWIVSIISSIFNFNLLATGRFVSSLLGFMCVVPIYKSLFSLGISRKYFFYISSLFLTSPLYLYWSGTFMIESTALFFTLYFFYYSIKIFNCNYQFKNFFVGGLFLTLALLQKVTTVLPVLVLVCIYYFFNFNLYTLIVKKKFIILFFLLFILPVLILICWVNFTDSVKELNPIGLSLTSKALHGWNWGDINIRFSKLLWIDTVFKRNIISNSPLGYIGLLASLLCFSFSKYHTKKIIISLIFLFIFPFVLFPKLHQIHNYYQYANFVFYILLLSTSIIYLTEFVIIKLLNKSLNLNIILAIVFTCLVSINFSKFYFGGYGKDRFAEKDISHNRTYLVSEFIKKNTPRHLPIIVYGFDWSSDIAFHSERKSLTLPWGRWDIEAIEKSDKFLPNMKVSAIVNCYDAFNENSIIIDNLISEKYQAMPNIIDSCRVYLLM